MKANKMIAIILLIAVTVIMLPLFTWTSATVHADDEWQNGKIAITTKFVSPDSYRNSMQSPKGACPSWVTINSFSKASIEIRDSAGQVVGSGSGRSDFSFGGLKAGDYTIAVSIPDKQNYNILQSVYNGSTPVPSSRMVKDWESTITINEGDSEKSLWLVFEYRAFGLKLSTEFGTFENGEKEKVYYDGTHSTFESGGFMYSTHSGIYYGDRIGQNDGMNYIEEPVLSDAENRRGFTFKGWKVKGAQSDKVYRELEVLAYVIREDTVFEAVWGYPTHKVTFATDVEKGDIDGKAEYSYERDYNDQTVDDIPEIKAKDGYEFLGWYRDFTTNVIPEAEIRSTIIDKDLIFFAKYREVKKDDDNGDGGNNGGDGNDGGNGNNGGNGGNDDKNDPDIGSMQPINDLTKTSPIGSNEKVVDAAMKKLDKDGDVKGATFGRLKARGFARGKKALLIKWTKTKGAKKYILYGTECNHTVNGKMKKFKYKKLKTFRSKGLKNVVKKIEGKKLTKGKYCKFIVVAVDKKGKVIAVSKTVHVTTAAGKKGNYKSIKKVKPKKAAITLRPGKTIKVKAKEIAGKKKVPRHRKIQWESSDPSVAKVNNNGKIRAKKKGTCKVWGYTQNGVYTTYTVKVK